MSERPQGIHVPKGPTGTWVPGQSRSSAAGAAMTEATGSSQKALRALYRTIVGLCQVVQTLPGARRPDLDYVAADLWEVGLLLGEVMGDVQRPQSAWPEGEAPDEDDIIDIEQRDDV